MPQAAGMYYFSSCEDDWSRPAVILLHGAGGNHLSWPPELRRLSGQRIYALDLPGHGKSDGIGRQSISDYASCVLAFMDELKLRKAVLVGHSMGGGIALEFAACYPQRTLGVAILSAGPLLRVSTELLEKTSTPATFPLAIKAIGELAFSPQVEPRLKENALGRMSQIRSSVLHGDFIACDAFDITDRLEAIAAPLLIISGSEDRMVAPHYSQAIHQKISNSLLHTVNDAGHMVMLENPQAVANILQFFLSQIEYQPGSQN